MPQNAGRNMVLCRRLLIANGEGSLGTYIAFSILSGSEFAGNWHQARCEGVHNQLTHDQFTGIASLLA